MNKVSFLLIGLVVGLLSQFAWADEEQLELVKAELTKDRNNPILQMHQQMLLNKMGTPTNNTRRARWNRVETNLSREVTGGGFGRRNELGRGMDLLTGPRAIEESLQLGSVGRNQAQDDPSQTLPISDLTSVEIQSHPWQDMIDSRSPDIPGIANLVPKDMLFVHMANPEKFLELETLLEEQRTLFGDVYRLGQSQDLKPKIMKRLGLPDADALILGVEEMAFVSMDLAFAPRTDYALIAKPKNALAEKGFEFLVSDNAIYKSVQDHLVVATTQDMLNEIENLVQSEAMVSEPDYQYTLLEMEPNRDGLVYLSEAFIRKLTGPEYRLNSRRRNTVIDALETLQYAVFAYRRITGQWPSTLVQMMDEGYLAQDTLFEPNAYAIEEDGRVVHQTWGSLWEVTPVNRVPITMISAAEKTNYEQFSRGYQSFFREFFDPIGIAFTVSDQLYLHTLIMPLIDASEYRDLQRFFSGPRKVLDTLFNPKRTGALQLAGSISMDDILVDLGARRSRAAMNDDVDIDREALIRQAEEEIAKEVLGETLEPGERVLDFVGDEVFFGVGEENSFSISNIADIDVWLGVKLNDRQKAESFFRKLWQKLVGEFRGGLGGFGLSSTEPLKNEYNGQEFYMLPTGMINIFYIFYDDAFYVTISQLAMNRIIDGYRSDGGAKNTESFTRSFAHIGDTHNIAAFLNLEHIAAFKIDRQFNIFGERVSTQFRNHQQSLSEAMTLAKLLPDHDGGLSNVSSYYRDLPDTFYNARYVAEDGVVFVEGLQQRSAISDVGVARTVQSILDPNHFLEIREQIAKFRGAGLGASFIPEGLEVKMSIGNPNVTAPDPRFGAKSQPSTAKTRNLLAIGLGVLLVLALLVFFARRKT